MQYRNNKWYIKLCVSIWLLISQISQRRNFAALIMCSEIFLHQLPCGVNIKCCFTSETLRTWQRPADSCSAWQRGVRAVVWPVGWGGRFGAYHCCGWSVEAMSWFLYHRWRIRSWAVVWFFVCWVGRRGEAWAIFRFSLFDFGLDVGWPKDTRTLKLLLFGIGQRCSEKSDTNILQTL